MPPAVESIEAIKGFSGDDVDIAHIEPDGLAALTTFDKFADNFEVVYNSVAPEK